LEPRGKDPLLKIYALDKSMCKSQNRARFDRDPAAPESNHRSGGLKDAIDRKPEAAREEVAD